LHLGDALVEYILEGKIPSRKCSIKALPAKCSEIGDQCYRYWDHCDNEEHCDDGSDEGGTCKAR